MDSIMMSTIANAIAWVQVGTIYLLTIMLAFVTVYYMLTRKKTEEHDISYDEQSFLEPGPERIRSSKMCRSTNGEVLQCRKEDVRTLYDVYRQGARLSNNGKCLGWRGGPNGQYVWQSYEETILRAKNFGSGLRSLGLSPTNSALAIYLQNCPEWIMAELAAFTYSMVVIPIYDTLGSEACSSILKKNKITVVLSDDKKVSNLLDTSKYLKTIITLKEVSSSVLERAQKRGVDILTFNQVESRGVKSSHPPVPPKRQDLSTICYTSGTVGIPKGVMLTHGNIVAAIESLGEEFLKKDDVMISYLPLGHMLERIVQHAMYKEGGAVGFFGGDIKRLKDDLVTLKPTVMVIVPRLLNKFYDSIMNNYYLSESKLMNWLFQVAFFFKEYELKRGVIRKDSIWDWLVFRNVQEAMGGRLRLTITSSAPVSETVLTFVRCVLGCQVREGYGQTESLVVCVTLHGETTAGHVGPPVPSCKIKLVDVPEMEYYAADDKGEICVKGSSVFKGYYDDPERTMEAFDKDNWLHTGDIGEWLPNGTLKIIDRKKHIFKLSQGEYIAPEKIENVYLNSRFVDQIVVHGESLKSCVIAIVVPNREAIIDWSLTNDIGGPFTSLCQEKRVKNAVLEDMQEKGKIAGLKSFEQVKDIYLHPEPFSIENGRLTPTMKTKRRDIPKLFKKHIEDMYMYLP